MRKVLTEPAFRKLFAAMSTSMFGDSVMLLVLSMWVKSLTGSNGQAGLTFFWLVLPALFAPAYGVFLDRVRRKPLLVWGNAVSAVAVLPLLLVHDASDVWIVYAVAFLYGISFVVLPAGTNGLLKEMLPDAELVDANSSLQTVKEGYRLIGPLVGAGLFGWVGGGVVAVVDSASFLAAAVVIATIRVHEQSPERSGERWLTEMSAGVRHLVHEPVLKHVLVAFAMTLFVLGYLESSIYALLDFYHRPVTFAGVLVTAQGVGAIGGGITSSRWVRRLGEPGAAGVGLALLAGSVGAMAATNSLTVVLIAMAVSGYAIPMLLVSFNTLLQRRTPAALMGRVSAAVETLMGTPQAISLVVGSALVVVLDFHVIFAIIALVTASGVAYLGFALRSSLWRPVPAMAGAAVPDAADSVAGPPAPTLAE